MQLDESARDEMRAKVLIIQEHLPHYRAVFFEKLRADMMELGIHLDLVHGREADSRMLAERLEWSRAVRITRLGPFRWHHIGRLANEADLIVVPQELKYLRCHWLYLKTRFTGQRFAYWGHGRNFQSRAGSRGAAWIKEFISKRVDWWFAYNDLSARIVRAMGYPAERTTSVGNAIDTLGLMRRREAVSFGELENLRATLGIESEHVALFNGAIYAEKRIGFLLESARAIRRRIPDFTLLVIGEGPERSLVRAAALQCPWIHDLGPMRDDEKVPYWMLSKLLLMPGLVGLVVVDSFALGVPMVTTDYPFHSPEIDYLENGVNGLMVECGDSAERYADAVVELLLNPAETARLAAGAARSAHSHTVEGMVARFSEGIMRALRPVG
jgi:glycosyltransferase involved in cell wall biosynthesis